MSSTIFGVAGASRLEAALDGPLITTTPNFRVGRYDPVRPGGDRNFLGHDLPTLCSGDRICTCDLRFMRPARFYFSTPRSVQPGGKPVSIEMIRLPRHAEHGFEMGAVSFANAYVCCSASVNASVPSSHTGHFCHFADTGGT